MTSFTKYILQFVKDTDKSQTHLSFNNGKYNVPDEKYDEFYSMYYNAMIKNEDLFLIEKVYQSHFSFFLDIEIPKKLKTKKTLTDEEVIKILKITNSIIIEIFDCDLSNETNKGDQSKLTETIISKRDDKYHVNYTNLIVNSTIANYISVKIKEQIKEIPELIDCIDTSAYRTGLRLLGSKKSNKLTNDHVEQKYTLYDIYSKTKTELHKTSFSDFMKTVVRQKGETQLTKLKKEYTHLSKNHKSSHGHNTITNNEIKVTGIENNYIANEITKLFNNLKITNHCFSDIDLNIQRIYARQNKLGMFCYYVSINEMFCPFKQRKHTRPSSPLYIEIAMNGIYMKCYDEDCLRRKFPETGIPLPTHFESEYPNVFLSMTTKYWKTEVTISDEVKRYLEDSLSCSHYQIAKAAFNIYKDRFCTDDVKNSMWYEFDGIRWKRSHLLNILISEDLPRYYNGIKISDTSLVNDNLQDFLVNDDKIDANIRNNMVDKIIKNLENVNFKNNIMTQLCYLYKTHDPDFYVNLDSNPYLIGFNNGVYDFKQNFFRQSTQKDYLTFSTGYDFIEYDESYSQVKEIYDFLEKIITNKHVREYLLKTLGKALVGIPEEKFYIWTGLSGANGKSTLVNFLEMTLGDYTTSVDVSLLTNKRSNAGNASPDIIRLRGRRLFTFQEPEHDDKLRTGILKQYTGGDTIVARELFKSPITFKLQGTMVMCCNDLPAVASIDGGTWRRIRVIEFKSRFCENPIKENEFAIDPNLKSKLSEWRPYFMSILIHWYNKYLYEGIYEPEEVKKATEKYKVDNDKFNEFFDECLEESTNFIATKEIYNTFVNWWTHTYPTTIQAKIPTEKELCRAMKIKYGNEKEHFTDGKKHYGFTVKLKYDLEPCELSSNYDDC
jgi:P4 family phage/plasmid primase-like protien